MLRLVSSIKHDEMKFITGF